MTNFEHSEVLNLNDFATNKYNLLVPYQSLTQLSPLYKVRANFVQLSSDPKDGDCYKVRRDKIDGEWIDLFALTAVALGKLATAAGVRPDQGRCYRTDDGKDRYKVSFHAQVGLQGLDGRWYYYAADKEVDLLDIRDEMIHKKKAYPPEELKGAGKEDARQRWAEEAIEGEFLSKLHHKVALAQTGAMSRAIRKALPIRPTYLKDELDRQFVAVQVYLDMGHPMLAPARDILARQAIADLYGNEAVAMLPSPAEVRTAEATVTRAEHIAEIVEEAIDCAPCQSAADENISNGELPLEMPGEWFTSEIPTADDEEANKADLRRKIEGLTIAMKAKPGFLDKLCMTMPPQGYGKPYAELCHDELMVLRDRLAETCRTRGGKG